MYSRCKIFTPTSIVSELLNLIGYTSDLFGKKIIENSCGNGNILMEVIRRYIVDSISRNRSIAEIKIGLQSDIYGMEIDKGHYEDCIINLNSLVKSFNITDVKWNIVNGDFLKVKNEILFDFVVGNPPYINYRDLTEETRCFLKEKYESCSHGKFDYCYAFIEASIKCLNQTGKMAYLIPNSIFKNVYAQNIRDVIFPSIVKIIDYTTQKIFNDALTSSAILMCQNGIENDEIEYLDIVNDIRYSISKKRLQDKWIFSNFSVKHNSKKRFGDYFIAAYSVATLFNEAYILKNSIEEDRYIVIGEYKLEKDMIRDGASPRSLSYNRPERIIFPYKYINNKLVRYTSSEFEETFPETTNYLKIYSEDLSARKSDNGIEWFEYGRSQALAHLNQHKLLLSTIVTKEVKVYKLDEECIPYSGIYIVPKSDLSLDKAKEILESNDFYIYVKGIGINANGSSLRITAADINNYMF